MSKEKPVHTMGTSFSVQDHCLLIGGVSVTRLAARVGRTPFYAYDRAKLDERVAYLRSKLPDRVKLHYAVKANPMPALVQHMAGLVDGFDVASGGELKVTLDTPMPSSEISFAGPGKSRAEMTAAVAAGVTLNMESFTEMHTLTDIGSELGIRPRVAVRVNPDFELKSSGMKMSGGPKQFGVDAEQVPDMLAELKNLDLEFRGFHIFSGSQNLKAESIIDAQTQTLALAVRLAAQAPAPMRLLNIGGGFGIPYFPGDLPLDLTPIGENLKRLLDLHHDHLEGTEVVIELGRYLVGEAGVYICRVIDRKISRGQVFLITDGGLHHHLAASGNFGQVIRKNYPADIANKIGSRDRELSNVVGPLCTPLDILSDKMPLPAADIDDLVVVYQSGAYGFTASPIGFLSHPAALEVLV